MTSSPYKKRIVVTVAIAASVSAIAFSIAASRMPAWESKFVKQQKDGSLQYKADKQGNFIPDFSAVGYYHGDKPIPEIPAVATVSPSANAMEQIQAAIDKLSAQKPDVNGFRGAILLKRGEYRIPGSILIKASGIVLRGEGNTENGTRLIATAANQKPLIDVQGNGKITEVQGTRVNIADKYVPTGATSFNVTDASAFKAGDHVILFSAANDHWISDLKMDQIVARNGTKQWRSEEYNLSFERTILSVNGNTVELDNPVMMPIDADYGGGALFKYTFNGRIQHIGIENLYCESPASSDTAEDHSWDAIHMDKIENGWVSKVTARYFSYACVNLSPAAKNITVTNSRCFDHKSKVTGGRRYSFNNDGQQNLFLNCVTADGRHDYVTGAKTLGPNVFYNCSSTITHADIGPHHRWAVGTLYDNITTDGEINVQDRGNYGSGHGWAGVTQVLWNCKVRGAAVQNPWASGKNYCIGLNGEKRAGRFKDRMDGEWEGLNKDGLQPPSLYKAQLEARQKKK
ncbi:hypothetical protein [Pseudobacter ginsenosidimutans]|jgi:hypothetical protein|uniref:Pectate lyase-like protein n=1 Tax=Pseudobacter ginsenosidimutans TaxID=661488 RepID=A0A4Q7N349_9BACT|nr:hypothetical protein [Pseudobacter ginsenosidimutans]RZS74815.1 hypothetical protein EV199_0666 [Pseudobacter ginsenosidimutans]